MVFENYEFPRKRYKLDNDFDLVCPSCLYKSNLSKTVQCGKHYKITCPNCNTNVGFVKGKVKARKLGSYIRLIDTKNKQISIDINIFNTDFDVRKDDLITLVFYLTFTDRTPVLIINHTVKEFYNFECIGIKGITQSRVNLLEYKKRRNRNMLGHMKISNIDSYDQYENLPKLDFVNIGGYWLP